MKTPSQQNNEKTPLWLPISHHSVSLDLGIIKTREIFRCARFKRSNDPQQ
jgi:hypothetical protein